MTYGTPKTLIEAINNGIDDSHNVDVSGHLDDVLQKHIRDYISQKVTAAMLSSNEETERVIYHLFKQIVNE